MVRGKGRVGDRCAGIKREGKEMRKEGKSDGHATDDKVESKSGRA